MIILLGKTCLSRGMRKIKYFLLICLFSYDNQRREPHFPALFIFTVLNTVVKMDTKRRTPITRITQSEEGTAKRQTIKPTMLTMRTILLIICSFFINIHSLFLMLFLVQNDIFNVPIWNALTNTSAQQKLPAQSMPNPAPGSLCTEQRR